MKIFHIVENLDKGAVENWLINSFIESRKYKPDYEWTFYCILGKSGKLDQKVLENGGKIIYSPVDIGNKSAFLKNLRKELVNGKYDIIHSHHDYLSGFYLLASIGIKFKKRLLHVHNTDKGLPTSNKILNAVLLRVFWWSSILLSDKILCISDDVLVHYLGSNRNKKGQIIYYGIDLNKFRNLPVQSLKKSIGLGEEKKVLLFAGRLNPLKNPVFCVEVLQHILKTNNNVHLAVIGKGEKEDVVIAKSKEYKIESHVHLMGWRDDIPAMMQSADLFIFPRIEYPKEGLGIVMIESQAAALPTLISNGIVKDTFIIKELINVLPLKDNPSEWADRALQILNRPRMDQYSALEIMEGSVFSLPNGTKNLLSFYE